MIQNRIKYAKHYCVSVRDGMKSSNTCEVKCVRKEEISTRGEEEGKDTEGEEDGSTLHIYT
jgi:hypothetical protein